MSTYVYIVLQMCVMREFVDFGLKSFLNKYEWLQYDCTCEYKFLGEHVQRRFPAPVPSRATDQAAQTGIHHSDTTLDIRAEF